MGRFVVDTTQMSAVSGRGVQVSSQLQELRGRLDAGRASAGAAGAAHAVSALEGACTSWSTGLGALAEQVSALGQNLDAAARAYEITDNTAIGGR
jgi:uncharacterized protein YukE